MAEEPKKAPQTPGKKAPHRPEKEIHDETYDKTIEDSFPASDPLSSIPDPEEDENAA